MDNARETSDEHSSHRSRHGACELLSGPSSGCTSAVWSRSKCSSAFRTNGILERRPDFAFVAYDRWRERVLQESAAWELVPNLAVEVISPSNLAEDLIEKIDEYFHVGVQLVWVIYPRLHRVYVYESPTRIQVLQEADPIDGGSVLPGFQLALAELFAVLTRPAGLVLSRFFPVLRFHSTIIMARIRTFIAVDLGKAIRARTVAMQETLARTGTDVKWVESENLHVSLLFLGEVDDREVPAVCRVVGECSQAAAVCNERGDGRLLSERRAGRACSGSASAKGRRISVALHDALEPPLMALGCYRREERKYTPHVTLGRVKSDRPTDKLTTALARHAGWQGGEVTVTEVLVLSSKLSPHGPEYAVLSRAKLGGG